MRNKKGAVSIRDREGSIQLMWRHGGKRYYLALGLPTNILNLGLAETLKRQIEADFVTDSFDPTLEKYRPTHQKRAGKSFIAAFLARDLDPRIRGIYRATVNKLTEFGGAEDITPAEASRFVDWLRPQLAASTLRAYIVRLSAIWNWAVEEELTTIKNPWRRHIKTIKVDPPQPKPFTQEEVDRILAGAQGTHYAAFIEFLLRVGCRLGEAIALKWEHVDPDCGGVLIIAPKTHNARKISLSPQIQKLLLNHRPAAAAPDSWVFPSHQRRRIIATNFRVDYWQPLLKAVGVSHRPPGNCRHTAATHLIEAGVSPVKVAGILGNSPMVIFKHYYAAIGGVELLDLYNGADKGAGDEK